MEMLTQLRHMTGFMAT